jgi:hypothetical protein
MWGLEYLLLFGPPENKVEVLDGKARVGFPFLMLLGHPERRREIWNNRVHCVLAFGSEEEARVRLDHFREDLGRRERAGLAVPVESEGEMAVGEIPRFRLSRRGRRVHLEVTIDARRFRALLEVWAQRAAWDWGEDDE